MNSESILNHYICNKLNPIIPTTGKVLLATINDKEELAKYWYYAHLEMNNVQPITKKESTEYVEKLFKKAKIYVCKNDKNVIVSIGYYEIEKNIAKISGIYTIPSERRNGYATTLVSKMTNDIMSKGYIPELYADKTYKASNKLYEKLGFVKTK